MRGRRLRALAAALGVALGLLPGSAAGHGSEPGSHPEPPAIAPLFEPPAPGSYELPPIGRVAEYALLDARGRPARVPDLAAGQVGVVSFVYARCGEAHGCPRALATLQRLDRALAERESLAGRVRLVTVSFDPARDTPERMGVLRRNLAPRSEWRFVTAPDPETLAPVLDDYGQRVMRRLDPEGADTGVLQHVLKVFLVDDQLRIRNVYSAGLLDARILLNDIQTVLAE